MGRTVPSELVSALLVPVLLSAAAEAGLRMSILHPLLVPSTSNPSRMTRILPHESQFGGTRILSLSITLCLRICFLSWECMPSVEWTSVGREFGNDVEVYIRDAPSAFVS